MFQYVALSLRFPRHEIWAPNWTAMPRVFDLPEPPHLHFASAWLDRLLRRRFGRWLMRVAFGYLRLGRYVHEPSRRANGQPMPSGQLRCRRGLTTTVYVDGGYYQNLQSLLRPVDFRSLAIHDALLQRARAVVLQGLAGRAWPQIAMHVRRTDYLHYHPFGQADVTLPASYYMAAVSAARRDLGGPPTVVVVTDDKPWCRDAFATLDDLLLISDTEEVDFAILSMFSVVVIANSTFSLAAACVGPQVQRIIAPAYWFGRAVGQWLPPAIRSDDPRFNYI